MENELVIITGHAGGIGAEITKAIIEQGYEVLGIDKLSANIPACTEIITDLQDITNDMSDSFETALEQALVKKPVKSLINCAAVQHVKPLSQVNMTELHHSLAVNVLAPLRLVQLTMHNLAKTNGVVINIGSIHSRLTKKEFLPYSVSKAALTGLTRAMSLELGEKIRVVEIQPAAISTPMLEAGFLNNPDQRELLDEFHPTGTIGRPDEVAELCVLILKYSGAFLNGAIINLDGGISHALSDPSRGARA